MNINLILNHNMQHQALGDASLAQVENASNNLLVVNNIIIDTITSIEIRVGIILSYYRYL